MERASSARNCHKFARRGGSIMRFVHGPVKRRMFMKALLVLGIAIAFVLTGGRGSVRAAGCDAIGNVRFICDQVGPEDLAPVPGSDWVLSSGQIVNGSIRVINLRD